MKVLIEKLDHFARGITHINNKICFVEKALPNEELDISIINDKKSYQEAIINKFYTTSSSRVQSICPFYDKCGGCNSLHMDYVLENSFKEDKVKEIISKFSNVSSLKVKKIKYSNPDNYRNKVVLHGDNKEIGLYEDKSNNIVPINNCLLLSPKINELIKIINNQDIIKATIKVSNDDKEQLLDIEGKINNINEIIKYCDVLYYNNSLMTEKSSIISAIGKYKFQISRDSFFQVNRFLTKELYDEVKEIVKINKPNNVLDLYCGTGTIGIYLSKYCKRIIGIDYNKDNIKDANNNKELNKINNIEFICDKVENKINMFKDIDLIIVDPPRKGLDKKTKDYLLKISSKIIIYVSCDPVTLARDIKDLSNNYIVQYIRPFNMFPRTEHCESVCVLERR